MAFSFDVLKVIATLAPASANARATCHPMPEAAPVIRAVLPRRDRELGVLMGHMYVTNKEAKHAKTECESEADMVE
jgi:hypothetical protein